MGTRAMENRIKKLKEIELKQEELKQQADAIKEEIKKEMAAQGANEIHTPNFVIRFKEVISQRFDTKSFQKEHKALYDAYTKATASTRFTIA